MSDAPERPRMSGGIFLALGPLIGAVAGMFFGEPIIGLLCGFGLGVVLAVLVWWLSR